MTAEAMTTPSTGITIHPGWVRICHWINALAILMMIGSGWQIYDASPLFSGLQFSKSIALGQWLGGGAALAFRGDVGAGHQRAGIFDARPDHRPLPPQAVAHLAVADHGRREGRADLQARA